jgi:hypothetical protein
MNSKVDKSFLSLLLRNIELFFVVIWILSFFSIVSCVSRVATATAVVAAVHHHHRLYLKA